MVKEITKTSNENDFNKKMLLVLRACDEIIYAKNKNKEIKNIIIDDPIMQIKKINDQIICLTNDNEYTFSSKNIDKVTEQIYDYLEREYPINYNYRNIDPIYFSIFLYDKLPMVKKVVIDDIELDELKLLRETGAISLEETECFKALQRGEECEIYTPFNSNHIVDSDYERLMTSMNSIIKHGYPYFNRYITVYNDEPYIRDGQHRACILKKLYGNISIPILRIYLDGDDNGK